MQGKKLKMFISHRHDDLTICEKIITTLSERAAGKIEFLFAPKNIADGQEWYNWIKDNAPNADIFLFIYTRPSLRWDWALFETGMFEAMRSVVTNSKAFVCLHAPGVPVPEPVRLLQTRPATTEKVLEWLKWLFGERHHGMEEPINADYAKGETIRREALEISELIRTGSLDDPEFEERLRNAVIPEAQRILRNGLRLGFFFRWCVAEPRLNTLRLCPEYDDATFLMTIADLARDMAYVHEQGKNIAFLTFLEENLENTEYQQVRVIFDRWSHHSHQLLLQIEQYQGGQRHREGVITSLQKLINLNRFFMALFATAMTRLVHRDKPAFSKISEQIEIDQCTTV